MQRAGGNLANSFIGKGIGTSAGTARGQTVALEPDAESARAAGFGGSRQKSFAAAPGDAGNKMLPPVEPTTDSAARRDKRGTDP